MTHIARRRTRVIKLGGSLLGWDRLTAALQDWLNDQPPAVNVLIAGGGELAEFIRQADATHALGEENSHRLCVELMGVSAQLVSCLFPQSVIQRTLDDLRQDVIAGNAPLLIFDPRDFLARQEMRYAGVLLPHTWQVTSDSIAARVAEAIGADELVLLKSAQPPDHRSLSDLAAANYVDGFFPITAEPFVGRIRFVNLRCR